jgi:hypothetical protein
LTRAIKGLAEGKGDQIWLESPLIGFARLRVGDFRVIYAERSERGRRMVDCLFAERRSVVYDLFAQMVVDNLVEELSGLSPHRHLP